MPTHVALLRGINVGGRSRVAMAELRTLVTGLGHTGVATYIQSGNVVFTPGREADPATLAAELEQAIKERLGVAPRVVVLTRDELAQVVRDNPYPHEENPKAVHAIFFPDAPSPELAGVVAAAQERAAGEGSRDTAQLVGRTLYLHTPDGFGRSRLAELLMRASDPGKTGGSGGTGTARNWATVTRLLAMCDAPPR